MTPTHANKNGVRYRYYVTRALAEGRKHEAGHPARVPAPEIEQAVLTALHRHFEGQSKLGDRTADYLSASQNTDRLQKAQIAVSNSGSIECSAPSVADPASEASHLIEGTIDRVDVYANTVVLKLQRSEAISCDENAAEILTVPWARTNTRPRREVVEALPVISNAPNNSQRRLVIAIATARSWFHEIASGAIASVEAISIREGMHPKSIRSTLSLAFLAPDLVEHLLDSRSHKPPTQTEIVRNLPALWAEQRRKLLNDAQS